MSSKKVSGPIAAAVAMALVGAGAHASDGKSPSNERLSKEQSIGIAGGAITGALIGGPFGAAVGFIVGAAAGTHAQSVNATERKADALTEQLAKTKSELSDAQTALASAAEQFKEQEKQQEAAQEQNPMFTQLAQRLRTDVLFRTASAELDISSSSKLTDLGAVLANYPGLVIDIDGYADPRGKAPANMELSAQRAAAVRAALITGGMQPDNIRVAAHGEQLSTATKGDMEAYAWERRVSLSVTPGTSNASTQKASTDQVAKAQ